MLFILTFVPAASMTALYIKMKTLRQSTRKAHCQRLLSFARTMSLWILSNWMLAMLRGILYMTRRDSGILLFESILTRTRQRSLGLVMRQKLSMSKITLKIVNDF